MNYSSGNSWDRFKKYLLHRPELGLTMDVSRMGFEEDYLVKLDGPMKKALAAMAELEAGAIANPDENRMVGHYWLRNSKLAPNDALRGAIEKTHADVKNFAKAVISHEVKPANGAYERALIIGIGGSALGPQFVSKALGKTGTGLKLSFFDNTDPDGMETVLAEIGQELAQTLVVIISKSGGTKETRNGMLEAKAAFTRAGIAFERSAVAITGDGSELHRTAIDNKWLITFPMWDWVGGRTSELSAVGLLPAALQGIDTDELLKGANATDVATRDLDWRANPAALMAAMWHYSGNGKGTRDLVVLPYKDRLELLSKYLQQLIMESLGKELDLDGKKVNQGLAVYGNKGATDQHAYVQQLRDGINNFFGTFINVLRDRDGVGEEVSPGVHSGDYLNGFYLGTRAALTEGGRESLTITIPEVSEFTVGCLIALFERAVGLYATLVNVNAYHQPGVEAGKKAATKVIELMTKAHQALQVSRGKGFSVEELAEAVEAKGEEETLFLICQHMAANSRFGVEVRAGATPCANEYRCV